MYVKLCCCHDVGHDHGGKTDSFDARMSSVEVWASPGILDREDLDDMKTELVIALGHGLW